MLLQLATWQEVDTYLERSRGVIIPIGSTEQHGPLGLIGTDALCPEVIAKGISERIDAMVAPTLSIGMAQHHLGFAGSISLRPSTLIAVVRDVVQSLARHGFERCYFLNGHGGNVATVNAAFSEIYADASFDRAGGNHPAMRCKLSNWYMAPGVKRLSGKLFGGSEGSHATPSEISLTYFAYPDAVKSAEQTPKIAPTGPILDADDYRRRFPDGRIGADSSLATIEAGEQLYEAAVADLINDYEAFAKS
jgi:creatinine amidohydrolase